MTDDRVARQEAARLDKALNQVHSRGFLAALLGSAKKKKARERRGRKR